MDHLLHLEGIKLSQLNAIFVAVGPGTFNGIRVALSTAKGLASSLSIPLLGVSALEVEAYPFACTALPIVAIHDIGRSELAIARYQQQRDKWKCLESERVASAEELYSTTCTPTVFCGEIPASLETTLRQTLSGLAIVPDQSSRRRRPAAIAAIAWPRLCRGSTDDIATLQPIYMRRPHITVPKPQQKV
jgi:tRNA threonylcarbamoyladenosine biosynthesis protein TsaB